MKRGLVRPIVAFITLVSGLLIGLIHQQFIKRHPIASRPPVIVPVGIPVQVTQTEHEPDILQYPDNVGIRPSEIESFIDAHPQANLDRLWQRLKIKEGNEVLGLYGRCGDCKAQGFRYNLDDDAGQEIVLRIADEPAESYRYLIFKERSYDDVKLLGHIDAHGKYRPSTHFVMVSGGRAWLVVEQQGASGSGLSAYLQTVYQVSGRGVKPLVWYFSEVSQWGDDGTPIKYFTGRPTSFEDKDGKATATVSYDISYSYRQSQNNYPVLFAKQQVAVLESSIRSGRQILNKERSEITAHELDTIYNFDSMGPDDFLTYNRSELRAIAQGKDSNKRQWLKEFLQTCSNGPIKRELVRLLK